ncbi:pirin family protein [Microbacteriaceae bacterium VKM Ac-2855]|nr:pirin family protein [Microbacteriaceae bacterium VKM Ac-2855]
MSNLEERPTETLVDCTSPIAVARTVEVLEARQVPLGGPRAIEVRRTLPQRARSTIGAWCFADHYGPVDVTGGSGMDVPPHPHIGLQTVSWLFSGEIEHRDSVGSEALIHPGQLNLMTAGRGISHSEVSTGRVPMLHGVQLWVALPEGSRRIAPFFEHHEGVLVTLPGAEVRVFVGMLLGASVDATTFSPLVAAQIDLEPSATVTLPVNPAFEHGLIVDIGPLTVAGTEVDAPNLAYVAHGSATLTLSAGPAGARAVLIGGEPLGERLVMWWNFVGRDHDEVVQARTDWQHDVIDGADAHGRFGAVPGYTGRALPAPTLPTVRLKPRG